MNNCTFLFFEDLKGDKHPITSIKGVYTYKASPATHWTLNSKAAKEKINDIGATYYASDSNPKRDIEITKQVADKLKECIDQQTIKN